MKYAVATIWVEECDPTQFPELYFVEADDEHGAVQAAINKWTWDDVGLEDWEVKPQFLDGTGPPVVWRKGGTQPALLATAMEIPD